MDLGLIRAGLVSVLVGVGHHSFHEVMTGAQHALDEIDRSSASVYVNNWGRYWDVYPLTEDELRTFVARDGLFPDEHARALHAPPDTGRALHAPPDTGTAEGSRPAPGTGGGAGNDGDAHG